MNPPSISIFTRAPGQHASDASLSSDDLLRDRAPIAREAGRFGRKPYSPPRLELLED